MGIRAKLITGISILSILAIVIIGISSYTLSRDNALDEARRKGTIIFNYIQASGEFFSQFQYPLIMEIIVDQDRFYPEIMSKFVVSRMEYDIFKKTLQGYRFKQATIDPLWPDNKADNDELAIIDYFSKNPSSEEKEGVIDKDGEKYFYTAKPIRITNEQCLRCHGNVENAPKDQIEIYGTENGYNWKMNDTVGTSIVYISISDVLAQAKKSAMKIFFIAMGAFLMTILSLWIFVDKKVVTPIIKLSDCADGISKGQNLTDSIGMESNDEIGALGRSIDRLRISVNKLISRAQR